jgi:hypothetical protein
MAGSGAVRLARVGSALKPDEVDRSLKVGVGQGQFTTACIGTELKWRMKQLHQEDKIYQRIVQLPAE